MKTHLNLNEVHRLEKAAGNPRDELLARLLGREGCRVTEALNITEDDIDFKAGTVTIQHLKSRTHIMCPACQSRLAQSSLFCSRCGAMVSHVITKSKEHRRMRIIPVDKETLQMIREYIDQGNLVSRSGKRYLFGITRNTAWRIITALAREAGLPKLTNPETGKVHNVSPHKLRDAFAVHAMKTDDSGNGMRLLQEHLGHASFNTTARYRKVAITELKEWHSKLWEVR